MPKIGNTKLACELGRRGRGRYIWAKCEACGQPWWTIARGHRGVYKPESKRCKGCAVKPKDKLARGSQFRFWVEGRQKHSLFHRWNNLLRRARRQERGCISFERFKEWYVAQEKECHYCECPFGSKKALADETIDRLDNNEGYIASNMVLACRRCNIIKGSWFTPQQMIEIANEYIIG